MNAHVLTKVALVASCLMLLSVMGFGTAYGYSSSGSKSKSSKAKAAVSIPTPEILGAEDFKFLVDLSEGSTHADVKELQKRLRTEGFFTFPTDTGYFGPITKTAVEAYQRAHPSIGYVTGFFGPLTRAEMNK